MSEDSNSEGTLPEKVPRSLFKFRSWKDPYSKRILTDRTLWFASPLSFNDPFDCSVPYRYDLMSEDEFVEYGVWLAKEQDPRSVEAIRAAAKDIATDHWLRDPEHLEQTDRLLADKIADSYGILSFSGVRDDILLWSHYADSHCGFCMEFDGQKLYSIFDNLFDSDRHLIIPYAVKYSVDYPILIPSEKNFDRVSKERLRAKSDRWSYEAEFRFVYVAHTNLARYYTPDAVKAVYLGYRMPLADQEEVSRECGRTLPGIPIFRAKKKGSSYGLDFVPVET